MNILLLTAHDIAEFDDLRMFTNMGADVFSIGAYTDPHAPGSVLRPALPNAPQHPDLAQRCIEQREKHADDPDRIWIEGQWHHVVDWAKADLHPDIIEWADVIICHHYLEPWIVRQWSRIKHKRVIWRTCGQSNPYLERSMARLRPEGLEIVRYSPKEQTGFGSVFAGQDALIRFGKYPDDYGPWVGDDVVVGNVTQDMLNRGEHCGLSFWLEATRGLPVKPAGGNSEHLPGGVGTLSYPDMLDYLRHIRCYLYTGTQPASYTLGLIEAMMTGVPVVSIGPERMWMPGLFEGHEIVGQTEANGWDYSNELQEARGALVLYLKSEWEAEDTGDLMRTLAVDLFGVDKVSRQWATFLGIPVREAVAA